MLLRAVAVIAALMLAEDMGQAQVAATIHDSLTQIWDLRFQQTIVTQGHLQFSAAYSGPNSLQTASETKTSITTTLFLGIRPWTGGELYLNPEMSGGQGMSGATGVAGFPNGETFRIGDPTPTVFPARVYVKETIALTEQTEHLASDINQLSGSIPADRMTFIIGKFGLADFFDDNTYSHDPRTQFLNWALMNNGAWDYAADTRGYTWGLLAEYHTPHWSLRAATTLEPKSANGLEMDTRISRAFSVNAELERHFEWSNRSGVFRFFVYRNQARMGNYAIATSDSAYDHDITLTRRDGRTKYGFGINVEQQVSEDGGLFGRIGWNDGINETWAYTEIDRTVSVGGLLNGTAWNRLKDQVGLAYVFNAISQPHLRYLAAGGDGFLLGDGGLRYGPEMISEAFYSAEITSWITLSADYQFIVNPGYNRDRGPVHVFAVRVHTEI